MESLSSGSLPPRIAKSCAEAIFRGLFRQIRFILDSGVCPNIQYDGHSAFRLLALVNKTPWAISMAQNLLEHGGLVGIIDKSGRNAFHEACIRGRYELLEVFLKAADFDLLGRDGRGNTGIHLACSVGNDKVVQLLIHTLQHYKCTLDATDRWGRSPLMVALKERHWGCVKFLLEAGASLEVCDTSGRNGYVYQDAAGRKQDWLDEGKRLKGGNLRFDDVIGWNRQQERLRSAPPTDPLVSKIVTPVMLACKTPSRPKSVCRKKVKTVIDMAIDNDVRNDPVEMFNESPLDHFNENKIKLRSQPSFLQNTLSTSSSEPTASWRRCVRPLYNHMEFQFSHSYRQSVKVPILLVQSLAHMDSLGDMVDKSQKMTRRGSNVSYRGNSHRDGKKNVTTGRGKGSQKTLKPTRQTKG